MTQILMPKATAVWLIDNTALTFQQISEFCTLHILEVEGIADGDVASGIRGADPIANGQLAREEIEKGEICTQIDLDDTVKIAAEKEAKRQAKLEKETGESLKPVEAEQPNVIEAEAQKTEHTLESLFKPSTSDN